MNGEVNPRTHHPTNLGYTSYIYTRHGFKVVSVAATKYCTSTLETVYVRILARSESGNNQQSREGISL